MLLGAGGENKCWGMRGKASVRVGSIVFVCRVCDCCCAFCCRLEAEFGQRTLLTSPGVTFFVETPDGRRLPVVSPAELPKGCRELLEPMVCLQGSQGLLYPAPRPQLIAPLHSCSSFSYSLRVAQLRKRVSIPDAPGINTCAPREAALGLSSLLLGKSHGCCADGVYGCYRPTGL